MVLSPLDIKNKTFTTKLRGFDQDEVDDFLDQIVLDYEEVIRQKRELEKALKHAEEKLSYFNELKDALNQSIIVAQDTADKLKINASKESNMIISNAEAKANQIINKATMEAHTTLDNAQKSATQMIDDATQKINYMVSETDELKKTARAFYRNLTLLVEEQMGQLKSQQWEEILKPFDASAYQEMYKEAEIDIDHILNDIDQETDQSEGIPDHLENTVDLAQTQQFDMEDTEALLQTLNQLEAAGLLDDDVKEKTQGLFSEQPHGSSIVDESNPSFKKE